MVIWMATCLTSVSKVCTESENDVTSNGGILGQDLSLRILHAQNLLSPSHNGAEIVSQLTPEEMCLRIIRRECARRTFWLVHMIELLRATFTRRPMMYKKEDLEGVRLPCDAASFDLALEAEPGLFFLLSFLLRHDRGYTK